MMSVESPDKMAEGNGETQSGPEVEQKAIQKTEAATDILDKIALAESRCADAEAEMDARKIDLKEARAAYDKSVKKLRRLARAVINDADRPLFDVAEQAAADNDAAWRETEIYALELSDFALTTLKEADVETIDQLEDLRAKICQGQEKWPKGIGPTRITKIEDAVLAWFENQGPETDAGDDETDVNAEDEGAGQ